MLAAVRELTPREREAFQLKFRDGLSYREIGRVMGVSLGQVSKLVTGALGAIRERLRADGALAEEAER